MANDLNICIFTGRLGREPELKETTNSHVCNISIAVGGSKKVGDNWEETTDWVPLVFWGRDAQNLAKHIPKGGHIRVTGQFRSRTFEKDGATQYVNEIHVRELQFLGSGQGKTASSTPSTPQRSQQGAPPTAQEFDDDIPFTPIQSYP